MKSLILALTLLAGAGSADPGRDSARELAIGRERAAGTRVEYYAKQNIIAERDRVTAQIAIAMTNARWNEAVRQGHPRDAGYWAKRHSDALAAAREARQRAVDSRAALAEARAAFEVSAAEVRRLRRPG